MPIGAQGDVDLRVVVRIADVLQTPSRSATRRRPVPPVPHPSRFRRWGVEHPETSYPFRVESDRAIPDASSAGEACRAIVAVAAGLSLAVLSYLQFRGARGELPVPELTAALTPPSASDAARIERAAVPPEVVADAAPPSPTERPRVVAVSSAPMPAQATIDRVATMVRDDASPLEALASPSVPELVYARESIWAAEAMPAPTLDPGGERVAAPAAVPEAAPVAYADPAPDEDHIRAALTRWRAAYSALDASAAREVWPSVDARALERAFHALKSQELRFDRCDLTVDGSRAHAACTGRAVYVPRVGNQSPRATSREWTFELKKSDQRWTIASARSS